MRIHALILIYITLLDYDMFHVKEKNESSTIILKLQVELSSKVDNDLTNKLKMFTC